MISARRAALLGLTVPLSAVMLAVLGLWPEEEEETIQPAPVYYGSGRTYRGPYAKLQESGDLEQHVRESWDWIERVKAEQAARAERESASTPELAPQEPEPPAPGEAARPAQEIVTRLGQEIVTKLGAAPVPVVHVPSVVDAQEHAPRAVASAQAERRDDMRALLLILAECA